MSSLTVSLIVFACVLGGAFAGVLLRRRLPEDHLNPESKDVIRLTAGVLGTLTGMVLGLLVASAKASFDAQRTGIAQLAGNVVFLDRTLAHYGPDSKDARDLLRRSVLQLVERTWSSGSASAVRQGSSALSEGNAEDLFERILSLGPKTDAQRTIQGQALKIAADTGQMRWLLFAQRHGSSIPVLLLAILVFWLTIVLGSFGLFAPRNLTALTALAVSALAVSCAVFLVLELDRPFAGMIAISSDPLQRALEQIGR